MDDGLFPFDAPRTGQAEFLADARAAVDDGAVLLAQAPTGLGKTAVALAATLEAPGRRTVFFTTCRRSQHRIAVETARRMVKRGTDVRAVDLMARRAMCPAHGDHLPDPRDRTDGLARTLLRFPLHVQEAVALARRFGLCPYRTALRAAREADLVVGDYNHLFGPEGERIREAADTRLEEVIAVVDEAHNLPGRCRQGLSRRVTARGLEAVAPHLGRRDRPLVEVARVLRSEARYVGGESKVPADFLERLLARAPSLARAGDPASRLARLLGRAEGVVPPALRVVAREARETLEGWREPGSLRLLSREDGGSLARVALDARPATREVFRRIPVGLLMSGTLHPGGMYVDLLDIPRTRARVRAYRPDFPPENRLLAVSRTLSLAHRRRPGVFGPLAREVRELCEAVPGNVAAFFPSYDLAAEVGRRLAAGRTPKPLLWERRGQTKAEKEGLLRSLEAARAGPGRLLLAVQGGSLSEGIDYPGGLLQAVIVAGLALRPPGLEVEALRAHYARLFGRRRAYEYAYLYPALHRMVQCAGRCIRGPRDVGAVVLLDNRLLRPFVRERLPEGFDPEAPEDLAERVRRFFAGVADGTPWSCDEAPRPSSP